MEGEGIDEHGKMLSKRGKKLFHGPDFFESIMEMRKNIYDEEKNQGGIINLGVAESVLSYDLMKKKIEEIRREKEVDIRTFGYNDFSGDPELREVFARFFEKHVFRATDGKINKDNFIFTNGGGTVVESLGYYVTDPNESVMIASPLYFAFPNDFEYRFGTNTVLCPKIYNDEKNCFEFDFEKMDQMISTAENKVKALIICHPNNPTGEIYTREQLTMLMDLCLKHNIHFVSDEVYCLSMIVHGGEEKTPFVSAYNLVLEEKDEEKKKKMEQITHIIYSLSKDFGLNGFRVGVFYSRNQDLIANFQICSYSCGCSSDTLDLIKHLFSDEEFISSYIVENQKRLTERFLQIKKILDEQNMINDNKTVLKYIIPKATLFVWINFLSIRNFEDEKKMSNEIMQNGTYFPPGRYFFSPVPGWFRLSFTGDKMEIVELGLKRCFEITKKYY